MGSLTSNRVLIMGVSLCSVIIIPLQHYLVFGRLCARVCLLAHPVMRCSRELPQTLEIQTKGGCSSTTSSGGPPALSLLRFGLPVFCVFWAFKIHFPFFLGSSKGEGGQNRHKQNSKLAHFDDNDPSKKLRQNSRFVHFSHRHTSLTHDTSPCTTASFVSTP